MSSDDLRDLDAMDRLCDQLAGIRRRKNVSQKKVADLAGTTQSAVSDLETGYVEGRLTTYMRHARALGYRLKLTLVKSAQPFEPSADVVEEFVRGLAAERNMTGPELLVCLAEVMKAVAESDLVRPAEEPQRKGRP